MQVQHSTPSLNELPSTVGQWWSELGSRYSDFEIISRNGNGLRYSEIEEKVSNLARGLLASGSEKGSKIGLLMPNGPEWFVNWLAIERIGAIAVTLSTFSSAREFCYAIRHADLSIILMSERYLNHDYVQRIEDAFPEIQSANGQETLTLMDSPYLRQVWVDGRAPDWSAGTLDDLERLGAESQRFSRKLLRQIEQSVAPTDLAMLVYTSGSTAEPKAVMHTQSTIIGKSVYMAQINSIIPIEVAFGDRSLVTSPFFWIGGFLSLIGTINNGGTVICRDDHSSSSLLDAICNDNVTSLTGSESVLRSILDCPEYCEGQLEYLKPQNTQQLPFFYNDLDPDAPRFSNSLGMTETFGPHSGSLVKLKLPSNSRSCMGKALASMELKVIDPKTKELVPAGEWGELCVRGVWLMEGFYKRDKSEVFEDDGFYRTGDKCRIDEDGYLYFQGRLQAMIKTSGANVSPEEVEEVLLKYDDVVEAAVLGIPDSKLGEMVVAVVAISKDGNADEKDLKTRLRSQLSSFKVPKKIIYMERDQLPRTSSNKIRKPALVPIIEQQNNL